jgi:hypothetical protein
VNDDGGVDQGRFLIGAFPAGVHGLIIGRENKGVAKEINKIQSEAQDPTSLLVY